MRVAILPALSRDQNEKLLIKSIRVNLFLSIHYIYILLNKRDTNHQLTVIMDYNKCYLIFLIMSL